MLIQSMFCLTKFKKSQVQYLISKIYRFIAVTHVPTFDWISVSYTVPILLTATIVILVLYLKKLKMELQALKSKHRDKENGAHYLPKYQRIADTLKKSISIQRIDFND